MPDPVLVTGAAGFIGFHVAKRLLDDGHTVVDVDNLNDEYEPRLMHGRLALLEPYPQFRFFRMDVAGWAGMEQLFESQCFHRVIHLAV
jgi:UDP-glucuronate 4-epimerase